jgi:hypothetical protein
MTAIRQKKVCKRKPWEFDVKEIAGKDSHRQDQR